MRSKIDPKKLFYLGRWLDNVLDTDFWSHWAETEEVGKITKKSCNGDRLNVDGHFYHSQVMQDLVSKESFEMAQKSKFEYFENYASVTRDVIKYLIKKRKIFSNKKKFSTGDLAEFFADFQSLFTCWLLVAPITEGLEKSMRVQLKKSGLDLEDARPYFQSKKDTAITRQHKDLQRIVVEIAKKNSMDILRHKSVKKIASDLEEKHPDIFEKLKKHFKNYRWIGVHHFWGSPMTFMKLLEELQQEAGKYPFVGEKTRKPPIPKALVPYIDTMNTLAYWRFRCAEVSGFIVYGIWPQLHDVAKRLGVDYEEFYWFNRKEILGALENKKKLSKKIANLRAKGFGYISIGSEEDEILIGKEMNELLKKMMPNKQDQVNEIHGVTASRGDIVRGKIRIILRPRDVKEFRVGEILVSPETTPDFVLAMKMAGAIITDIGGLTSHAAIVARELKKPCVIGTKIATQVLHDGDLVEVDANKGVVKILKRKI